MPESTPLPRIGISSGDPAGIGPELALRLLSTPDVLAQCAPIVFADADVLQRVADACDLPVPERVASLEDWHRAPVNDVPVVVDCHVLDAEAVVPGEVDAACGRAASTYIEECVRAVMAGCLDAIATGPIHKESLRRSGVLYPGHTEMITALTGARRSCMMLTSEEITVSFVTTHVGYADVPDLLSVERVRDVIELTHEAMNMLRGRPVRVLVCALNPHAGENGLFGNREEERFIAPAIEAARAKGLRVEGPVSPDAAFLPGRMNSIDGIVCMYHDQGHIPFKHIAFDSGVNVTLGLPLIRTSVDHGTAFDIAWQGIADPTSFFHVISLTVRLVRNKTFRERPV